MAVSLPTAADVRKVREQARKSATERAEAARTPLLAVLGAGDRVVTGVSQAAAQARTAATKQGDAVQARVKDLPAEFDGLRTRLTGEELRKAVEALRTQFTAYYTELAEHGEAAWTKIRTQPQVEQAFATLEGVSKDLDARVDGLVDDAHDAAEKALGAVTRQTRVTGEKAARTAEQVADDAAETVADVTAKAGEAVAEAGVGAAVTIDDAGEEAAQATRRTARKAAGKTAPKATPTTAKAAAAAPKAAPAPAAPKAALAPAAPTAAPKSTVRKPATPPPADS